MTRGNGHGNGAEPHAAPAAPLPKEASAEIRRGVGRLVNGANELTVIALVSPVFLLGAFLAAEGLWSGGFTERGSSSQRTLDVGLFAAYGVVLVTLAVRAKLGARRAARLLPDALSDDASTRGRARAQMLRLAGPKPIRRAADWIASRGCTLVIALAVLAAAAWLLLPTPDPIWVVVLVGTAVAMDVRWRALCADVADQMPRAPGDE